MGKSILIHILFWGLIPLQWAKAQAPLTLDQCYELARQNYPLIKQKDLIEQSKDFSIGNIRSGFLPQFTINGQATYQSAVTKLPVSIPGISIQPLSKDQYKVYGELNQTLYDGGTINRQSQLTETNAQVEDQKLEVELYKIKERINQIYFGVLLVEKQIDQVNLLKQDLQINISRTESAIRNGTAFRSNADLLQAEYLKAEQRIIEMSAMRKTYLDMLGYFINQQLNENTQLATPVVLAPEEDPTIVRPELSLYNFQNELLGKQYQMSRTRNLPRVGLFLQGGYGKPALNLLENKFNGYYLGGLRLNWSLSGLYNSKRDKQLLDVNLQQVNLQKETFLFNTNMAMSQQKQEVNKLQSLIEVDDKIIELRSRIKKTAEVQQQNGVITTNDYLRELNAEDQAKQNKLVHEVQLLMALYNYQNTIGN